VPQRTCMLEDCERRHCARGLCKMHYKREMTRSARSASASCEVSICENPVVKDGYCVDHLYRCLDVAVEENWRSVVGWEGLYEVSDLGRVRSPAWIDGLHIEMAVAFGIPVRTSDCAWVRKAMFGHCYVRTLRQSGFMSTV
jgi:hypothetical protein